MTTPRTAVLSAETTSPVVPEPASDHLSQDEKDALHVLGYVFIQQRQLDKALIVFEALQVLFDDDHQAVKALAYVYLAAGRYAESLEAADRYRQAVTHEGAAPIALVESRSLWALGREDESRGRLRQYIADRPCR